MKKASNHLHRCKQALAFLVAFAVALCLVPGGIWQPLKASALHYSEFGPFDPDADDTGEGERILELVETFLAPYQGVTPEYEDREYMFIPTHTEYGPEGGVVTLAYGLYNPYNLPAYDWIGTMIERNGDFILFENNLTIKSFFNDDWHYNYTQFTIPANNTAGPVDYTYKLTFGYKEATILARSAGYYYDQDDNNPPTQWPDEYEKIGDTSVTIRVNPRKITSINANPNERPSTGGDTLITVTGEYLDTYTTLQIRRQDNHSETKAVDISGDGKSATATFDLPPNSTSTDETYVFEVVANGTAGINVPVVVKGTEPLPQPQIDDIGANPALMDSDAGPTTIEVTGEHLHLYTSLQIRRQDNNEIKTAAINADNRSASAEFDLPPNTTTADKSYVFEVVANGTAGINTTVVVEGEEDTGGPEEPGPGPEEPGPGPEEPGPGPEEPGPGPQEPGPGPEEPGPGPEEPGPGPEEPGPGPEEPGPDPEPESPDPDDREYRGGASGSGFRGGGQYYRGPLIFDILEHQADQAVSSYWESWNDGDNNPDAPQVAIKNPGYLSKEQLERAASGAREASGRSANPGVTLLLDTTSGEDDSVLQGRIYLDPEMLSDGIWAGVYTGESATAATRDIFQSRFPGQSFSVVSLQQQGSFGTRVEIAADVKLSGLNTDNLLLYSYDPYTGEYTKLDNTQLYIDTAGYLHFNTSLGGDIVVTDKALGENRKLDGVPLRRDDEEKLQLPQEDDE